MADRLKIIKDLRAKGATIRLMDDVAAYLGNIGGYDSPVFSATVEFILKIKDMLRSYLQSMEQAKAPKTEFGDKEFKETENVNFGAAKQAAKNDENPEMRAKILEHIETVEAQREGYVQSLADPQADKNSKKKKNQRRLNVLDQVSKLNTAVMAQRNSRQRQQAQIDADGELQRDQATRAQRQSQTRQVTQSAQRSSVTRMNLLRTQFLNALRMNRNKITQTQMHDDEHYHEGLHEHHEHEHHDHANNKNPEKTGVEVAMSKIIDEAVKAGKDEKRNAAEKPVDKEKGKFEKQLAEKVVPRADETKVAKMGPEDAIALLKNSGMSASNGPDMKLKKELDAQIAQIQGAEKTEIHR